MRVQGLKKDTDGWTGLEFKTTYRYGWESCLSYIETIYQYTEQAEILVSPIMGVSGKPVDIKGIEDIKTIPEAGTIEIRGRNKIYDNAPFQFLFFNQTDLVRLYMPTQYIESLRKSETEFLNEEEQKHTFDKFMDSIELNGQTRLVKYKAIEETVKQIEAAFNQYDEFNNEDGSDLIIRLENGNFLNLSKIVNKIRQE